MRALLTMGACVLFAMASSACKDDAPTECAAPVTATASCMQVCEHLFALHCQVGTDTVDCAAQCEDATQNVPASARVLACYLVATDCDAVDSCSETCGPGGATVPFYNDGGISNVDANESADDGSVEGGDADASL